MDTEGPTDAMWDEFPIGMTTEVNFVRSIKNCSICTAFISALN